MTEDDARAAAELLIKNSEMRGYTAKFAEVLTHPRFPNEYSVVFDVYTPEGNIFDGPLIVIVDQTNGETRFFDSL
jgi:hypothetical protein